jgi:2-phosphosulfolactate phosphatase
VQIEIGGPHDGRVCIIVDVLRASSTIVTLLERGCRRVVAAAHIDEALALKQRLPGHLLCGESGGLPPEGFDYGNSPVEFSRLDLTGKSAILATTNGTKALAEVADTAAAVLVGCLLNLTAVVDAATRLATELVTIVTIAPAGDAGSSEEDFAVARAMVALAEGAPLEDVAREVRDSRHAETLRRIGLTEDVDYCARIDVSNVVPVLTKTSDGLLSLVRLH